MFLKIACLFVDIQIRFKPHIFGRTGCLTFIIKVGLISYTQKGSFILGYQVTPQLSDYIGVGGNGFTKFNIHFNLIFIKPLWSPKEFI